MEKRNKKNTGENKQLEDGTEGRRRLVKKMKGNMRNMGGDEQADLCQGHPYSIKNVTGGKVPS